MGGLRESWQGQQIEGADSLTGSIAPMPQSTSTASVQSQVAPTNLINNTTQQSVPKGVKDGATQTFKSQQPSDSLAALTPIAPIHSATTEQTLHWFRQGPLRQLLDEQTAPRYRTVEDPTQIFGTSATINSIGQFNTSNQEDTSSNFAFQGLVLLLAITYIILLYNHLGDIVQVFSSLFRTRIGGDRLIEDPDSSGLTQFLNVTTAIGVLFMGILALKTGEVVQPGLWHAMIPDTLLQTLGGGVVPALILTSIILLWVIALYQNIFLRIIGAITVSDNFTEQLIHIKRIYFVLLTITTTPTLLLLALCPPGSGEAWFYVILVQCSITFLLFLAETLNLFITKKVSSLHWFLYLCAVEIFPISLLWLMAVR